MNAYPTTEKQNPPSSTNGGIRIAHGELINPKAVTMIKKLVPYTAARDALQARSPPAPHS